MVSTTQAQRPGRWEAPGEQLRQLAQHLDAVREEERARIAREIHDVLGQALTVLRIDLTCLEEAVHRDPAPEVRQRIGEMKASVDAIVHLVRRIATELRPGILDKLGPAAAVAWQAEEFEAHTGIVCTVIDGWGEPDLDRDLATALFRIFQEILTNVARHAGATWVHVDLDREGDEMILRVEDNGRGIRSDEVGAPTSLGLLGMRERLLPWKGRAHLSGRPGAGTTVTVKVPFAGRQAGVGP